MDDQAEAPRKPASPGKIIFWSTVALLVLLLVFEYFQITGNCFQHLMMKDWQSNLCGK